jgi:hypothetical protein
MQRMAGDMLTSNKKGRNIPDSCAWVRKSLGRLLDMMRRNSVERRARKRT